MTEIIRKSNFTDAEIDVMLELRNRRLPNSTTTTKQKFKNWLMGNREPEVVVAYKDDKLMGYIVVNTIHNDRWCVIVVEETADISTGRKLVSSIKETNSTLCGWAHIADNVKNGAGGNYKSPMAFYGLNDVTICKNQTQRSLAHGSNVNIVKVIWARDGSHKNQK